MTNTSASRERAIFRAIKQHPKEWIEVMQFYGDRKAVRSGIPYLNHIFEGLIILHETLASIETKAAWCLHPLCQADEDLRDFDATVNINPSKYSPRTVMFVMEYRNVANRYLSHHYGVEGRSALLSPIPQVNQMLVADKVQNRKDFEANRHLYENADDLTLYFNDWMNALGISEAEYKRLCSKLEAP